MTPDYLATVKARARSTDRPADSSSLDTARSDILTLVAWIEELERAETCSMLSPGGDFVCRLRKGHEGDHFGSNATWRQGVGIDVVSRLRQLRDLNAEAQADSVRLEIRIDQLKAELHEVKQLRSRDVQLLRSQVDALEAELLESKRFLGLASADVGNLRDEVGKLTVELDESKQLRALAETDAGDLREEMQGEIDRLTAEVEKLNGKLQRRTVIEEALKSAELKVRTNDLKTERGRLKTENAKLAAKVKRLEGELAKVAEVSRPTPDAWGLEAASRALEGTGLVMAPGDTVDHWRRIAESYRALYESAAG